VGELSVIYIHDGEEHRLPDGEVFRRQGENLFQISVIDGVRTSVLVAQVPPWADTSEVQYKNWAITFVKGPQVDNEEELWES